MKFDLGAVVIAATVALMTAGCTSTQPMRYVSPVSYQHPDNLFPRYKHRTCCVVVKQQHAQNTFPRERAAVERVERRPRGVQNQLAPRREREMKLPLAGPGQRKIKLPFPAGIKPSYPSGRIQRRIP